MAWAQTRAWQGFRTPLSPEAQGPAGCPVPQTFKASVRRGLPERYGWYPEMQGSLYNPCAMKAKQLLESGKERKERKFLFYCSFPSKL